MQASGLAEWGMGVGSFSPIWRPLGYNNPRWPLHRNTASQDAFRLYGTMRYEVMPYIYGIAHESGLPRSRPMALVYPDKTDNVFFINRSKKTVLGKLETTPLIPKPGENHLRTYLFFFINAQGRTAFRGVDESISRRGKEAGLSGISQNDFQ